VRARGERQLERLFCQIHSNTRSMHDGFLSCQVN
jgi:hypothetical protein